MRKSRLLGLLSITSLTLLGLARPVAAQVTYESFTYSNAADGNLTATFTLGVQNGYAVSGTGTVTSSFLGATDNLSLLTYNGTLPSGAGSINLTGVPVTNGFTWHTVPGGNGADFLADNVVNAASSPLLFDTYGIVFTIDNPSNNNVVGGLNIFDGSPTFAGYSDNFSGGGVVKTYAGLATLAAVPEPSTYALLAAGLGLLGLVGVRRRKSGLRVSAPGDPWFGIPPGKRIALRANRSC